MSIATNPNLGKKEQVGFNIRNSLFEHSGDMSRVFKKDFDIFFRKKGNFNRPSAENPKANISSC